MPRAWLAALVVLIPVATGTAQSLAMDMSFSAPAQASGSVVVSSANWVLLSFDESSSAQVRVRMDGPVESTNHTVLLLREHALGGGEDNARYPLPDAKNQAEALDADLLFSGRQASLFLLADSIQLTLLDARAALRPAPGGSPIGVGWLAAGPENSYRAGWPVPVDSVVLLAAESSFTLDVQGLRSVEWHNATVACHSSACPDGGGWTRLRHDLPTGDYASVEQFHYQQTAGHSGFARGFGSLAGALTGNASLDAQVNGTLRLPLARLEATCLDCIPLTNQTLGLQGQTELNSIQPMGQDRLRSGVLAVPSSVRLDETTFAGKVAIGAAATTGFLLAVFALLRLLPFLTARVLDRDSLLRLPSRRRVYDAVHADPGISFNELARSVGLPRSTVEHQVKVLCWAKILVAERDGNRTRYFENHGRYSKNWREQAGLRDPDLRLLHAWLLACPLTPQVDILHHAERAWDWSRAAAYRRLKRLENHSLVAWERSGGRKLYRALVPTASRETAHKREARPRRPV